MMQFLHIPMHMLRFDNYAGRGQWSALVENYDVVWDWHKAARVAV